MGKNLISQKRGKGSPTYRAPSFRYKGKATYGAYSKEVINGQIKDIIHCSGHSAPLINVKYENGESILLQAPEGVKVGDKIVSGDLVAIQPGNILPLKNIPEGTPVYNIEATPGDGGKFARTSGVCGRVLAKMLDRVLVMLPSKKEKEFNPKCRATIGIVAGSGRTEKPFLKAGFKYYNRRARNKFWPRSAGLAMNAVSHPFGGRSTCSKGQQSTVSRDAPPGAKVGKIAARRTGRRR